MGVESVANTLFSRSNSQHPSPLAATPFVPQGVPPAVLAAYGFSPKKDLLAQLLDLNLAVASDIDVGREVTSPGIPPGFPDPSRLITQDCIRP